MARPKIAYLFFLAALIVGAFMPSNDLSPNDFAAVLFKQLITGTLATSLASFERLPPRLREVAFSALLEEIGDREARIRAELLARGELEILGNLALVNPNVDLDLFELLGGWKILGLSDAYMPLSPLSYLVKNFITEASIVILFGPPKSMKSMLVAYLALCVAGGTRFLTHPSGAGGQETRAGPIFWIDLESGVRRMSERLSAFGAAMKIPSSAPFRYVSMPSPLLDFSNTGSAANLIGLAKEIGARLIVIDHLAQALGAVDENSPIMSRVMGNIRGVAEVTGASVLLVHHQTKNPNRFGTSAVDSLRGHSSIVAGGDLVALIERNSLARDQINIRPIACRGPNVAPFSAMFTFESKVDGSGELALANFFGVEFESASELIEQAILKILGELVELNQTALCAEVEKSVKGVSQKAVRKVIAVMELSGRIEFKSGPQNSKLYNLPGAGK